MPSSTRAALLLASPASGFLAAPRNVATSTRRHLATTPDELSFAAHYNSYDYNAESEGVGEDDWRGLAMAAGAMEESAENWAGLFTPWDASAEADAENSSLEKIYAVQRDPVNLPPTPQEAGAACSRPGRTTTTTASTRSTPCRATLWPTSFRATSLASNPRRCRRRASRRGTPSKRKSFV